MHTLMVMDQVFIEINISAFGRNNFCENFLRDNSMIKRLHLGGVAVLKDG